MVLEAQLTNGFTVIFKKVMNALILIMIPLTQESLSVVSLKVQFLPLLFILYVNDIKSVSQLVNLILFADDANMFISGNDLTSLVVKANDELSQL